MSHLHDITELPVYSQPSKLLTTQECVNVLLNANLQESSICSRVPFAIESDAAFIVDLNKLGSPSDINCGDMGVWKWGGSRKRWVSVDEGGFVSFLDNNDSEKNCYQTWKRYYSLKVSPDVKKMIIILEGEV